MTGRRLYDILCDAWAGCPEWTRGTGNLLAETPRAWSFLTGNERAMLNAAARRIKGTRR